MTCLYKLAAQTRLRFSSTKGELTVENLYDLPLTSKNGSSLDSMACAVSAELKTMSEESFVEPSNSNPRKKVLELSLDLLTDVIKTKQDENAARTLKAERDARAAKIRELLAQKRDQTLSEKSEGDLEKELKELAATGS